jgi:hypothetical protein
LGIKTARAIAVARKALTKSVRRLTVGITVGSDLAAMPRANHKTRHVRHAPSPGAADNIGDYR